MGMEEQICRKMSIPTWILLERSNSQWYRGRSAKTPQLALKNGQNHALSSGCQGEAPQGANGHQSATEEVLPGSCAHGYARHRAHLQTMRQGTAAAFAEHPALSGFSPGNRGG